MILIIHLKVFSKIYLLYIRIYVQIDQINVHMSWDIVIHCTILPTTLYVY